MKNSKEIGLVNYKDHDIIYLNYSGKTEDEILTMMDWTISNIEGWCGDDGNVHLLLVNMLDAFTTPQVAQKVQRLAKESRPYIKKGAVVMEPNPAARDTLQLVNRIAGDNRKMFDDETAAKEWLILP